MPKPDMYDLQTTNVINKFFAAAEAGEVSLTDQMLSALLAQTQKTNKLLERLIELEENRPKEV